MLSHRPEKIVVHTFKGMDGLIVENLPEPWKSQVLENQIDLYDVPEEIRVDSLFTDTSDYWAEERYQDMLFTQTENGG